MISIFKSEILSAIPVSNSLSYLRMLLLNAASSRLLLYVVASLDLPLTLLDSSPSNLTAEAFLSSSPLDFDLLEGVFLVPAANLNFLKSSTTSLLTILFSTVDEISDNG